MLIDEGESSWMVLAGGKEGERELNRITPLSRDQAHPEAQPTFDADERRFGVVLNPTRVFAHRPSILAASKALSASVGREAVLPASLRLLVCLRVATLVGCPF